MCIRDSKELDPSFYPYKVWSSIAERLRVKMAKILNCSEDHITHAASTSDILNIIANGYPLKDNETVCTLDKEYPSVVLPWMLAKQNRGIAFDLVSIASDAGAPTSDWLKENIPANTRVLNLSHVTFDTGKRIDIIDIGKFCKQRDIFLVIDATQSLGGIHISKEELSYIDVLACSSYKWILGPYGHAFAYFSKRAQELIQNQNANWLKSPRSQKVYNLLDYTTETHPGARCFDRGQTSNMLTLSCLEAGLDFLTQVGLQNIELHNKEIRDHFLSNLPKNKYNLITPEDQMGNIICLKSVSYTHLTLPTICSV